MSKITIETTITPRYLRNRTKDQLIDLVLSLLDQNDALAKRIEFYREQADDTSNRGGAVKLIKWLSIYDSLERHERSALIEEADAWLKNYIESESEATQ